MTDDELLKRALGHARDTRQLLLNPGARWRAADVFHELFGRSSCILIADSNTFVTAGKDVYDALSSAGRKCCEPLLLEADGLYAEYAIVEQIQRAIAATDAIPVAVGSGTINDLTKLAAHLCGRQYLSVATAASMDGYTAFGASITYQGSKQTFDCPAPLGVVADLEVIANAPQSLNASGYADLVAKCPAGADWILADGLGIDRIDSDNWDLVQTRLRYWMADPEGIRRGTHEAVRRLTTALMITGFAMQAACSSRPVSGAEHQFSHLWDMEHHRFDGVFPSHGFKVGIGTLASLALYEYVLARNIERLNIEAAASAWPDAAANDREISGLFPIPELARKARLESGMKHIDRDSLRSHLQLLQREWPLIKARLLRQLIPHAEILGMLRAAGCPIEPEQIGITPQRLSESYLKAYHIRRRFTILDLVRRVNLLDDALDHLFTDRITT
jgi:glycerol-1-phosphate dehydrogenase [NAD(P)+]